MKKLILALFLLMTTLGFSYDLENYKEYGFTKVIDETSETYTGSGYMDRLLIEKVKTDAETFKTNGKIMIVEMREIVDLEVIKISDDLISFKADLSDGYGNELYLRVNMIRRENDVACEMYQTEDYFADIPKNIDTKLLLEK